MTKYRPIGGPDDFDGLQCDLDGELPEVPEKNLEKESGDGNISHLVVKFTLFSILAIVSVTGAYGLFTRDWSPLTAAWSVGAAPFGAIVTRYVGRPDGNRT